MHTQSEYLKEKIWEEITIIFGNTSFIFLDTSV